MKSLGIFILILFAMGAGAVTEKSLLENLESRIQPLPHGKGYVIKSFTDSTQSYIYDQALAIIAFSHAQDQINAEKLVDGLDHLQNADGSLYFSYYLDGKSPYPKEGDKRYAGALAWVALAMGHYQEAFDSKRYQPFQKKLLTYLKLEIKNMKIKGEEVQAIRFNPTDLTATSWKESHTLALEHNLDLYAALILDQRLNGGWKKEIEGLKKFILSMWDDQRSHFWSGADLKSASINKDEIYLDNQSWTMLAMDKEMIKKLDMAAALSMNCNDFMGKDQGIVGFIDRRPVRGPASKHFVWSEGSLGQILAMKKYEKMKNDKFLCHGKNTDELLSSLYQLKKEDGGIAYSTPTANSDFTNSSSVAGTAWMYFTKANFNPFDPFEGKI
jgi:hypothetical protein